MAEGKVSAPFTFTATPAGSGKCVCIFTHPNLSVGLGCDYNDRMFVLSQCIKELNYAQPLGLSAFGASCH